MKNTATPQNNPDCVKHPLELMTSLHCLVAMVTLNSRWQPKSGTYAQGFFFFFFSSNHSSRQLFLPFLLFFSARVWLFFPSLFFLSSPPSLILWCQVPSRIQPLRKSRNQHKIRDRRRNCCDENRCGRSAGGEGARSLHDKPFCRQAGWRQ